MSKLYPISSIEFHNMIHMQGVNLGHKVVASIRKAQIFLDLEFQTVWITFNGKTSGIPTPSVKAYDLMEVPAHVQDALAETTPLAGPPYAVQLAPQQPMVMDPNAEGLDEAAAAHRAMVRAASANANRATPNSAQNDQLIQQARMQAAGIKTAQVSNPTQPQEGATVRGRRKALSHAELAAEKGTS